MAVEGLLCARSAGDRPVMYAARASTDTKFPGVAGKTPRHQPCQGQRHTLCNQEPLLLKQELEHRQQSRQTQQAIRQKCGKCVIKQAGSLTSSSSFFFSSSSTLSSIAFSAGRQGAGAGAFCKVYM